jgi:AcrR family transcriptional regulator
VPAEVRRGQIVDAAAKLLLEQGYLPLPVDGLARMVGVSKALVYRHFPEQGELIDAVLARELGALEAAGIGAAVAGPDLETAALAAGGIYFAHVAHAGPVAHYVLRDLRYRRRVRRDLAARRDKIMRRLARLARREFGLPAREAVAALNLVLAIPEEAGRLVWRGDLPLAAGEELCRRLIGSSLAGLRAGR